MRVVGGLLATVDLAEVVFLVGLATADGTVAMVAVELLAAEVEPTAVDGETVVVAGGREVPKGEVDLEESMQLQAAQMQGRCSKRALRKCRYSNTAQVVTLVPATTWAR